MVITYLGYSLVKIQSGERIISVNPYGGGGGKDPKFGADISISSMPGDDFGATENNSYGNKEPFVIDGPGEYEIGGIYIRGVISDKVGTRDVKLNTSYSILVEGISVGHLGGQKHVEMDAPVKEKLGEIDILCIPIGGGDVLSPEEAYKVATYFEPKVIIPVFYEDKARTKGPLYYFSKELGEQKTNTLSRFVVKKKDLEGKEGELIVLRNE